MRGTSEKSLYDELPQHRRWFRKSFIVSKSPNYLFKVVPSSNTIHNTRTVNDIPLIDVKHNFFKDTFFQSTMTERNKLDPGIRNSARFSSFKESILKFIRPAPNSIFQYQNPKGIQYLTQLRVNFSHLCDHNFQHSFQDTINPHCTCSLEAEITNHFILHCSYYENERHILLASIRSM